MESGNMDAQDFMDRIASALEYIEANGMELGHDQAIGCGSIDFHVSASESEWEDDLDYDAGSHQMTPRGLLSALEECVRAHRDHKYEEDRKIAEQEERDRKEQEEEEEAERVRLATKRAEEEADDHDDDCQCGMCVGLKGVWICSCQHEQDMSDGLRCDQCRATHPEASFCPCCRKYTINSPGSSFCHPCSTSKVGWLKCPGCSMVVHVTDLDGMKRTECCKEYIDLSLVHAAENDKTDQYGNIITENV